ncbi:MAG TPA: serine--tRNA ligase [Spirochaetota bacterium]|nr:serine--tRNA ligase [Spirochaetota bacterium]HQE58216.1 serine--tRNA ligase [Spirochaetota bacterium]
MIDPKVLRENPDEIKRVLKIRKMESAVDLTALSELDSKMLSLGKECDVLRESRNKLSKEVGNIKREGGDATAVMSQVNEVNSKIEKNEAEIAALDDRYNEMILSVPNILHSSVPVGNDEKDNVIVRVHGEKPAFDFAPKAHYDLGTDLDILDFERGVKLSGARFYVYKNLAAKLERAILSFMLDLHTNKHGYTEVFAPFLVNDDSMIGTGQYPKFKDEYYRMERDGLSLIPTAEVTLTNLYRDEILEGEKLPVYVTGQSSCFRREAGSAGRDTRGLIRVHQFQKVELVKFVEPETSFDELEKLVSNAEEVLKQLGLHYRVMLLCSADTSASSSKTYDIEVWMPGLDRYVEISSCSNFLDYQARRAKIRYKKSGGKAQLVHTLNGSGLAAGRTLAAVMENYQTKDGNIEIPEVLKPYMR